jgi:hypothetical protein
MEENQDWGLEVGFPEMSILKMLEEYWKKYNLWK